MRIITLLLFVALAACSDSDDPPAQTSNNPGADAGVDAAPDAAADAGDDAAEDAADQDTGEGPFAQYGCDETDGLLCAYESDVQLDPAAQLDRLVMGSVPSVGGREVPVALWLHPDVGTGKLPVVIWSHGGGYNASAHRNRNDWTRVFASMGFAVIQIAHIHPTPDQLRAICQSVGIDDPEECVDLTLEEDSENADGNPFSSIGVSRPADGSAVMDALPRLSTRSMEARDVELDADAVVIAGWSGGSQTVVQMAGARRNLSASLSAYEAADERPIAFIAVSPQGPGYSGFYENESGGSWRDVRGPMLVITGDGDEKAANDLTGPIRRRAFDGMPDGDKFLLYSRLESRNIGHGSYNLGVDVEDDTVAVLHTTLSTTAQAFVDWSARGDSEAETWLENKTSVAVAGGAAALESR